MDRNGPKENPDDFRLIPATHPPPAPWKALFAQWTAQSQH